MTEETNIIDFSKARRLGTKNQYGKSQCAHTKLIADQDQKVLECEKCGYVYTAWEYVWKLATSEERLFSHLAYARMEKKRLEEEIVELKRISKNTKAQIRRAKQVK